MTRPRLPDHKERCFRVSQYMVFRYSPCHLLEVLEGMLTFSDKFGHSNCVILRDSCKLPDLHFPPNAQSEACLWRNCAKPRNFQIGFESG